MSTSRTKIVTYTGQEVNPLALSVDVIKIADIAHSLALANRFAGHTQFPISVAQHSVFVARIVENRFRNVPERVKRQHTRKALLHDASEAYLGDVTKWLKQTPQFEEYRAAEHRAQLIIDCAFGCGYSDRYFETVLEESDRMMVRFEAEQGWKPGLFVFDDTERYPPTSAEERETIGRWEPWSWQDSEDIFLHYFQMTNPLPKTQREAV